MSKEGVENSPIRSMFWKDEILQVLYWMQGEGMGEKITLNQMLPLLNTSYANLEYHLNKLNAEGFLKLIDSSNNRQYSLTKIGKREGAQHFAAAFEGLQKAGHGECGPDCEFCYSPNGVKLDDCVHNCASQN
jgi:predicted transcriptional regulator